MSKQHARRYENFIHHCRGGSHRILPHEKPPRYAGKGRALKCRLSIAAEKHSFIHVGGYFPHIGQNAIGRNGLCPVQWDEPIQRHSNGTFPFIRDLYHDQGETTEICGVFGVMPFALVIPGLIVILAAIKGTYKELGSELVDDFKGTTGSVGYMYWVSSIAVVGALGYYAPMQRFSRMFMVLILLGMVLANRGIFAKFKDALQNPKETTASNATSNSTSSIASGASSLASASTTLVADAALFVV